jgi:hypothetical protein
MKTKVVKLSKTGKSMLVGHKFSKYDSGYTFGWVSNPDSLEVNAEIADFNPKGREPLADKFHTDGTPVMKFVFC